MWTEKDHALVTRLLQLSQEDKLDWLPTAFSNLYTTSLSAKHTLQIVRRFNEYPEYELRILDGENLIHTLGSNDFAELVELHERARRKAMNVDNTITDILTELEKE